MDSYQPGTIFISRQVPITDIVTGDVSFYDFQAAYSATGNEELNDPTKGEYLISIYDHYGEPATIGLPVGEGIVLTEAVNLPFRMHPEAVLYPTEAYFKFERPSQGGIYKVKTVFRLTEQVDPLQNVVFTDEFQFNAE